MHQPEVKKAFSMHVRGMPTGISSGVEDAWESYDNGGGAGVGEPLARIPTSPNETQSPAV